MINLGVGIKTMTIRGAPKLCIEGYNCGCENFR